MNAMQEHDHDVSLHHHRLVGAHPALANFNSVEIDQAETAEAVLHRLADFAARRGHRLRQIRYQTPSHFISIEFAGMGEKNPHGCEILIPTASADAHLLMMLERQPNVDERRRLEIAGHHAALRVEQCTRRLQHKGELQGASTGTDESATQSDYKSDLVGSSAPMKALAGVVRKIAPLNSTVLILGETGTGKELVARALHRNSPRANQPFVAINCNALTETIFDSQLLGHIRGAFTGAHRDEPGAVRAAAGGTLLLDEVGDMPLPLQGKLLRVLQERTVTPVGSHKEYKVDVRFIAATNKDLEREVSEERFRHDLYGRLRVQEIMIPPLRERLNDIPELVRHFEVKLPAEMKLIAPPTTTMEAIHVFCRYHWPGNVRELEHTMSRLLAKNSGGGVITGETAVKELGMSPSIVTTTRNQPRAVLPVELSEWFFTEEPLDQYARRVKAAMLMSLEMEAGNAAAAATQLGVSTKRFYQFRQRVYDAAGQIFGSKQTHIKTNSLTEGKGVRR